MNEEISKQAIEIMGEKFRKLKMRAHYSCQIIKKVDHSKYKFILLTLWVNIIVRYGIIGKFFMNYAFFLTCLEKNLHLILVKQNIYSFNQDILDL